MLSIGRPERSLRALRAGERTRVGLRELSHPEKIRALTLSRREDDSLPVRRDLDRSRVDPRGDELRVLRRKNRGAKNARRGRRPGGETCGESDRRRQKDRRDDPAKPLAAPPPRDHRSRNAGLRAALADPLQLTPEIGRVLPTVLGIFGQAFLDDVVERGRRHRLNLRDRLRLVPQDRGDERRLRRAGERLLPRRHLVEHAPEREDVRARVGVLPFQLLGRHVLERPEDRALLREVHLGRQGRQARLLRRRRHRLRQPEVEQFHAGLRDHHVAGLQVPVHDPLPVRFVESVGDLDSVAQCLLERQGSLEKPLRHRLALQVLHDQVLGVAFATHVMQRADVRVRELRDRLRLAFETLAGLGRRREMRRQHLDCDRPVQPRVARPIDLPHSARAEGGHDLVRPKTGPRGKRHPAMPSIPADERPRGTTSAASRRT